MRFLILQMKRKNNYKLVDITKGNYVRQEAYVIEEATGIITGTVIKEYDEPMEAINDLVELKLEAYKKIIKEEIKDEQY